VGRVAVTAKDRSGLDALRAEHEPAGWQFGTLRPSLPGRAGVHYWARRPGVLLAAPDPARLGAKIAREAPAEPGHQP
jgi:hypothetical protein